MQTSCMKEGRKDLFQYCHCVTCNFLIFPPNPFPPWSLTTKFHVNMERSRAVQFSLSTPSSAASSRSSSPAPTLPRKSVLNGSPDDYNDIKRSLLSDDLVPGQRGEDVYESTLSWWRAGLRRKLVATVRWESSVIAKMQVS